MSIVIFKHRTCHDEEPRRSDPHPDPLHCGGEGALFPKDAFLSPPQWREVSRDARDGERTVERCVTYIPLFPSHILLSFLPTMFLPAGSLPPSARRSSLLLLSAVLVIVVLAVFIGYPTSLLRELRGVTAWLMPKAEAAVSTDSLVGYWKFDPPTLSASLRASEGQAKAPFWHKLLGIETAHAAVSTDSLVGYWKFDEGTGTLAADSSGHSNNGTLTNGPTWSADPTNNITFTNPYALSFDGTDDYVDVGSAVPSPVVRPITVSAWVKADSTSKSIYSIFTNENSTSPHFYVDFEGGLSASYNMRLYSQAYSPDSDTFTLDTNWHHYVWVWEADNTVRFFRDGSSLGVTSLAAGGNSGPTNSIGAIPALAPSGFTTDGLLDDVRIYSRALSAGEIAALAAGNHTTAVWDGSSSTDWETAANWDINAVPDPFTHVIVRDTSNDPKLAASVSGASLTIEASSSLDLSGYNFELNDGGALKGGGTLKLKGSEVLSNLGNLGATSTGTVLYYGTGSYTGLTAGDAYNNLTINDGLVGYWPFDNGSGLSATEKSGHGNNGTLTGGPTWSATPTNAISFTNPYALSFDGTDDYVDIGSISLSSTWSASVWIKHDGGGSNYQTLFYLGNL